MNVTHCSTTCGLGVAHRTVACMQMTKGRFTRVSDDLCASIPRKPSSTVPCVVQLCTYGWDVKPWSQVYISTLPQRVDKVLLRIRGIGTTKVRTKGRNHMHEWKTNTEAKSKL